jgi:hypothetical protein
MKTSLRRLALAALVAPVLGACLADVTAPVEPAAAARPSFDLSEDGAAAPVEESVETTRHETAKNSIGNIR